MTRFAFILTLTVSVIAAPLAAQERGRRTESVPPGHEPPPGMCRIWIDGVPAGQQPAPTDCATAVRNRPANGRVVFGDDARRKKLRGRPPAAALYPDDDDDVLDRGAVRDADVEDDRDEPRGARRRRGDDRRDDDRWDDNDRRYERFFRPGSDICEDLNRDGRCDDAQRGGTVCVDRDRDGVCDDAYGAAGGAALPEMISAVLATRGERTPDVIRWIGDQDVTVRYTDADRDGVPERATWLDQQGGLVQVWTDRARTGRATRVEFFRDGRRVRVIGQQ
jgi:hypothetical protein